MDTISIISLDPTRWQEAKALRLEALRQDPTAFGSSYEEESQFEDTIWHTRIASAFHKEGNMTLYAQSNDHLVGMIGAHWSDRIKTGHTATLYSVYVTPVMRRKGIGAMLMEALLDELYALPRITRIALGVTTVHTSAIALYEKFGFKRIGIVHRGLKVDGQYYDGLEMEKLL